MNLFRIRVAVPHNSCNAPVISAVTPSPLLPLLLFLSMRHLQQSFHHKPKRRLFFSSTLQCRPLSRVALHKVCVGVLLHPSFPFFPSHPFDGFENTNLPPQKKKQQHRQQQFSIFSFSFPFSRSLCFPLSVPIRAYDRRQRGFCPFLLLLLLLLVFLLHTERESERARSRKPISFHFLFFFLLFFRCWKEAVSSIALYTSSFFYFVFLPLSSLAGVSFLDWFLC